MMMKTFNVMLSKVSIHKIIIFLAIPAFLILSYSLFFYGIDGEQSNLQDYYFIFAAISLIVWSAILGFGVMFLPYRLYAIAVFIGIIPSLFYFEKSYISGIAIVVFSLLCILPYLRAKYEYKTRTIFYSSFVLRKVAPMTLTLFALLAAILSYQSFGDVEPQDVLPKSVFEIGMQYSANFLSLYYEAPFPGDTVDEFLEASLKRGDIDFDSISLYQKSLVLGEARSGLAKSLGINLEGGDRMGDVIYDLLIGYLNNYTQNYPSYFVWAFSLGFFALLKTIFIPIGWLSIFVFWFIIKIGLVFGIMRVEGENVLQERLKFGK